MKNEKRTRFAGKALLPLLLCFVIAAGTLLPAFAVGTVKTLQVRAATESTITLRWSAVKGATGYQLQQYKNQKWTRIAVTDKTTRTVKQLSAGTAYAFRVRAVKDKEKGAFSATLRARTAPAQVEQVTVKSAKQTSVKLQWNKVKGAEGYRVQQRQDQTWVTVLTTEKRSATIRDLPADTAQRFRVAAFLTSGSKTVFGKNSAACKTRTLPVPAEEPDASEEEPQEAPKPVLYQKYDRMFRNGSVLMIFTTDDPELGEEPITAAIKDGSAVVDTMVLGNRVRMLYDAKADATYLMLPKFRRYTQLSDAMMEDMDLQHSLIEIMEPFDPANAEVYTLEQDGAAYTVEAFFKDDTRTNYYFKDETLVKIEVIEADGTVSTSFVQTLTDAVPDSLFEIPKNYRFLNLSFLF